LGKLRLQHKRHLQPEARVRGLRHRRIPPLPPSSRLRRDSKYLRRTCRRGNSRRRQENPARQANLEHPVQ